MMRGWIVHTMRGWIVHTVRGRIVHLHEPKARVGGQEVGREQPTQYADVCLVGA